MGELLRNSQNSYLGFITFGKRDGYEVFSQGLDQSLDDALLLDKVELDMNLIKIVPKGTVWFIKRENIHRQGLVVVAQYQYCMDKYGRRGYYGAAFAFDLAMNLIPAPKTAKILQNFLSQTTLEVVYDKVDYPDLTNDPFAYHEIQNDRASGFTSVYTEVNNFESLLECAVQKPLSEYTSIYASNLAYITNKVDSNLLKTVVIEESEHHQRAPKPDVSERFQGVNDSLQEPSPKYNAGPAKVEFLNSAANTVIEEQIQLIIEELSQLRIESKSQKNVVDRLIKICREGFEKSVSFDSAESRMGRIENDLRAIRLDYIDRLKELESARNTQNKGGRSSDVFSKFRNAFKGPSGDGNNEF